MPKQWGVNDKKTDAIQRKEGKKQKDKQKSTEEKEEKKWAETDKNIIKKLERKQQKEKKKEEDQRKKQEKQEIYQQEIELLPHKGKATKITSYSAKIQEKEIATETLTKYKDEQAKNTVDNATDAPIPVNLNHQNREEEDKYAQEGVKLISATGINDAFEKLTIEEVDKHPERRMKQAYLQFEDKRLPELKAEFPTLKRSQLLEMLNEEWKKCPENPLNKPHLAYNEKK